VTTYPFADLALSRRLELAEARGSARFVELRAELDPQRGAAWIEVAGAYAMFDGPQSPITQTFGLGMLQAPTADDFDRLERFFFERGAPTDHEVSPQADAATLRLLTERGYRPIEFTSVMFKPVEIGPVGEVGPRADVIVRMIGADEADVWARTAAEG
jgi:hypothetical protein